MPIDFSQVKAITIPEGNVKSVSVNGVVIWQEPVAQTYTITYRKAVYTGSTPATKTVSAGYALTSEDLPTQTDSTSWSVTGWTLDGTNTISAGYIVNSDIELCAIHKGTASATLQKNASNYTTLGGSTTASTGNITVGQTASGTAALTTTMSRSYTNSDGSGYTYIKAYVCGFGGIVHTISLNHAARVEWTPSRSTVAYTNSATSSQGTITNTNNYTACYPTTVIRYTDTKAYIKHIQNNNTNKQSYSCPEPHSGSTVRIYIQYGGGSNLAWRSGKASSNSTSMGSITVSTPSSGKPTETVYLYTTPSA